MLLNVNSTTRKRVLPTSFGNTQSKYLTSNSLSELFRDK